MVGRETNWCSYIPSILLWSWCFLYIYNIYWWA